MALNWVDKVNGVDEILAEDINAIANEVVALSENAGGGGGGFRKIGFTEDCDFVATVEDGLTAFKDAVEAASDGETFLVMPGVYKGLSQFDVVKDINFIGVGVPKIEFPVWISGGGVFSYEKWEWTELYRNVRGTWQGFVFRGNVYVGMKANPDGDGYAGEGVFIDCDFICISVSICGSAKNCTFDVDAFTSGDYYGRGNCCTEFEGCTIKASANFNASSAYDKFVRCDIYPKLDSTYITTEWGDYKTFVGCRMYALGTSLSLSDSHSGVVNLNDTIVFANSISGCEGGYLVKPTAN